MNKNLNCRICLEEPFVSYNLQEYSGENTIYDLIKKICPETCLENKPDKICNDCLSHLKIACDFKQNCETSDLLLKNINFEKKFLDEKPLDDFIDTNLSIFDEDYILDPDYMNDDLKPDFDSLDSKVQSCESTIFEIKSDQHEKRKFARNPGKERCAICSETFSGPSKLVLHAREVHSDLKPFKCDQTGCVKSYQNPKALKVHRRSHLSAQPFKCDECQASFHVKANFVAHMRVHKGEKFVCEVKNCGKSFSTVSYLKQHQIQHVHQDHNIPLPHVCEFIGCRKEFPDKNSLRSHQKVHEEKKLTCEVCGSKFRTNSSLKIHYLKHVDKKQFTCHICGQTFKYKNQCYDHVLAHTAKREFECEYCSKKFIKKSLLAVHIQVHLTERKFNCNECNKSFKTNICLYAHRRRHRVRIANFYCASCDKNFTSRCDLSNHVRSHTQEKSFACHIKGCLKIFVHKSNLNVHIKSHSETAFQCEICRKLLSNSNALRVHLSNVHKAEKKFNCESCTLTFASPQLLTVHLEIHKPRKFCCKFCNQRYNFEADLERHNSKMHQDQENEKNEGELKKNLKKV